MIVKELVKTARQTCEYFDREACQSTKTYIRSRWNPDGGVRGMGAESDLCYTAFAAMCMRALNGRIPKLRLWNYLRSFDCGESLDIEHLFCLVRLLFIYPQTRRLRGRLQASLESKQADSSTDLFFKVVIAEYLKIEDRPAISLIIHPSNCTSDLAASVVLNQHPDREAEILLKKRLACDGGFYPNAGPHYPTIDATAKALFALKMLGADLSGLKMTCLDFVESLRCDDGGYRSFRGSHPSDVKSTFLALVAIGSLIGR
ncbi:MAG: hypothetical protein JXR25_00200 [Pontiellaceae bacterium]|nr:hypothetical protein [Pontiellaceae bacterium]MBN2783219.1 hypothetical protein [Pontiellaceae bacterium]